MTTIDALSKSETMPNGKVTWQYGDGIALISLLNPPANGYSYEMMRDLDEAILRARFDTSVHVIVLAGHGEKFFCAGADISMLHNVTPEFKYSFCLHANETLLRLEHTPKLTIAALGGHCVGGGLEVALACDLRVARKGSGKCGLPEVKLGVLPGTGGTQRLARILGRARAIEWMATGKLMDYDQAESLGLIQSQREAEDETGFLNEVLTWANSFCPPHAASMSIGHIKRAVHAGIDLPMEAGLAIERELQAKLFASSDAKEGIAAFIEKRTPKFSGQ